MGLITKEVEVTLHSQGIKWYEDKGYKINRKLDKQGRLVVPRSTRIVVKVEDLPDKSNVKVDVVCDNCNENVSLQWADYKKCIDKHGKYYCCSCIHKLYGGENHRLSLLNKSISFEQWCINNNRKDILDRWDYELNEYNPSNISYGSRKMCWFKCPEGIHKSELNKIINITSNKHLNYQLICNSCNSLGQWLINKYGEDAIEMYWSKHDITNPYEISHGNSNKKVWIICPNCGKEKETTPSNFTIYGLGCLNCSDGISYGEKMMRSVLQQLNLAFILQLSKTTFDWCKNYKYDFYIPDINCIIETHGRQHYEESPRGRSFEEEQLNDKNKKELALHNHISEENYIVINCRYSNLDWIKNNILNSRLPELFDLSNIDWIKCHEYACSSYVKIACDYWNNGMKSIQEIANVMKLCKPTIIKYLKQGSLSNICNYVTVLEQQKSKE